MVSDLPIVGLVPEANVSPPVPLVVKALNVVVLVPDTVCADAPLKITVPPEAVIVPLFVRLALIFNIDAGIKVRVAPEFIVMLFTLPVAESVGILGAEDGMVISSELVGTALVLQLVAVDQFVLVVPTQVIP